MRVGLPVNIPSQKGVTPVQVGGCVDLAKNCASKDEQVCTEKLMLIGDA